MSQPYETGPANAVDDRTSLLQTSDRSGPAASDVGTGPSGQASGVPVTSRSTGPGHAGRVHAEEPRRHPVAYAALALSLLALLWLAISSGSDDGYQRVRVGTQDCLSVPQDNGPALLYCRANPTVR